MEKCLHAYHKSLKVFLFEKSGNISGYRMRECGQGESKDVFAIRKATPGNEDILLHLIIIITIAVRMLEPEWDSTATIYYVHTSKRNIATLR